MWELPKPSQRKYILLLQYVEPSLLSLHRDIIYVAFQPDAGRSR